jgi:hypothetical protein
MTNGEFISRQLTAFGITDADMVTLATDVELDGTLDVEKAERAMIPLLATCILRPYQKSINENGFSVSWDMSNIGWWYRYLCSKYGITPDANVLASLGLSVIKDRTSKW